MKTGGFQMLDDLDAAAYSALKESIAIRGVLVPVMVDQHARILDGHHRAKAAAELGVECPTHVVEVVNAADARDVALLVNAVRRHLDVAQRRQIVADLRSSGHSLRAIAAATGVTKSQIAKDVEQLSTGGQLTEPDRIIGQDGKSRPATRPAPQPVEERGTNWSQRSDFDDLDDDEPADEVGALCPNGHAPPTWDDRWDAAVAAYPFLAEVPARDRRRFTTAAEQLQSMDQREQEKRLEALRAHAAAAIRVTDEDLERRHLEAAASEAISHLHAALAALPGLIGEADRRWDDLPSDLVAGRVLDLLDPVNGALAALCRRRRPSLRSVK